MFARVCLRVWSHFREPEICISLRSCAFVCIRFPSFAFVNTPFVTHLLRYTDCLHSCLLPRSPFAEVDCKERLLGDLEGFGNPPPPPRNGLFLFPSLSFSPSFSLSLSLSLFLSLVLSISKPLEAPFLPPNPTPKLIWVTFWHAFSRNEAYAFSEAQKWGLRVGANVHVDEMYVLALSLTFAHLRTDSGFRVMEFRLQTVISDLSGPK